MNRILRCRNGHQWPDNPAVDAVTVGVARGCPVCGTQNIVALEETIGDFHTPAPLLLQGSQEDSPTDVLTLPSADLTASSASDLPTAEPTVAMIRGSHAPLEVDQPTLSLSPSEMELLDRTEADGDSARTRNEMPDQTVPADPPRHTDHALPRGLTDKRGSHGATKEAPFTLGRDHKLPERIAGYQILGELGRGGMGVVFKARQMGLNRLCALKMILAGGYASPESIARFRTEAEAIAHLQHPNIVQVYEIGEVDGCPYFSLEFVDGTNLQHKIDATPQPAMEIAHMMEQICRAVHAAHQRNILHRDLKPANVLLTKDNVPKITDFGLAKRLEETDHGQTRTGAILGTPSYMAPEQAMGRAKELGPPADIYSLGAILYDMLTGRPPFRGETIMDTLNQVQHLEPLPPVRLVPKVSRDLQTICLKALSKDPQKRYATAGAMAEDLRRFLEGEPILARPTPTWERAAKWVKRRPALASLIGVCVLAFFSVVTLGGLWLNTERLAAEEQAALKTQAAKDEKELREHAEENFRLAREAVDKMLTEVGDSTLRYEPGMELVRRNLLQKALGFYQKFTAARGDDPTMRYETALAHYRVGDIFRDLGKNDAALGSYQLAQERFGDLLRKHPDDKEYRQGLADCIVKQAMLWQLQDELAKSEKAYQEALGVYSQLAATFPNETSYQEGLASLHDNLAQLALKQQQLPQAVAHFDDALRLRQALIAQGGQNDAGSKQRLARLQRNRAVILLTVGKESEAEKALLAARDIAAALSVAEPQVPDYLSDWAHCCLNLALCYKQTKRPQAAFKPLYDAKTNLEKLTEKFPHTPVYRQNLAHVIYELGMLHGEQEEFEDANEQLAIALEMREKLVAEQPKLPAARLALAQSHISLGIAQFHLHDTVEAQKHFQEGVDLLEQMKPVAKTSPELCSELARGHQNLAVALVARNKTVEADKSWERLLKLREELAEVFPQSRDHRLDFAAICTLFAEQYQKAGKPAEAITHWRKTAIQYGTCMLLTDKDTTLSADRRKALLKDYGDKTLAALQRAVKLGFNDVNHLLMAPQYELVRERAEFKRLVKDVQAKG